MMLSVTAPHVMSRAEVMNTSTSCCEIPTMGADNSALVLEISVENAERFVATAWHAHCPPHRGDTG
jgi:hypothetical protein